MLVGLLSKPKYVVEFYKYDSPKELKNDLKKLKI